MHGSGDTIRETRPNLKQVMSPSTRRRARSQDSGLDQLQIEDGRVVEDRMVLPGIANGPQEEDGQFGGHLVPIPMTPMTRGTATPVQTTPVRPPQGNPQVLMPQGQVQPSTPLFDEEQLNRLNRLHESAPHLYGLQKEVVEEPVPPRPRFLEQDGVNVTNRQLQRQCVDLMDENEKLRRELDQIREGVFQTPSDDKKIPDEPPGLGMSQETARRVLYSESPLEMFVRMTSKPDAGLPSVSASAPPLGREREDQGRPRPLQQGRVDGRGGGMEQEPVQPAGRKDHRQLDLMEKLVQLMIEDKVGGGQKTELLVESVKPGTTTLVELPEVSTTAPIDLQDWLTAVEPAMGDLSDSSSSWWTTLLEEAQSWYLKYQQMPPLQRSSFVPEPSDILKQQKWSRVEKRAVSLLLTALPLPVRQELVSSRSLTALKMITRLFTLYQPGGVQEKGVVLSSLEAPAEVTSLPQLVNGLRTWMRWRRRSVDLGLSLPDATILMRGLSKMMKRVLESAKDLQFRLQLARNTLMLDTVPNHETVLAYAEYTLAEAEQMAAMSSSKASGASMGNPAQAKAVNVQGKSPESPKMSKGDCKFFLTDEGCRRGSQCRWKHAVPEGEKRCYECGSISHFKGDCPVRKGTTSTQSSTTSSPTTGGVAVKKESVVSSKREVMEAKPLPSAERDEAEVRGQTSEEDAAGLKGLLEEAGKMLKGMQMSSASEAERPGVSREQRLKELQKELEMLKGEKRLNAVRVTKIETNNRGLLDSGATHPLRSREMFDDYNAMAKVTVSLATGKDVQMRMTSGGVLITNDTVDPIVPLGMLMKHLGCVFRWNEDECRLIHPGRGNIEVEVRRGCPEISKEDALKLIAELETEHDSLVPAVRALENGVAEAKFLEDLVENHPVLEALPKDIKDKLIVVPHADLRFLGNKRARKRWARDGCSVHLYAGPKEGFTLSKALEAAGGNPSRLIEIDIQRSENHDMVSDEGAYPALLRAGMDGVLDSVVGGPNCRTRSVLRHYEKVGFPGPSRTVDHPFGLGNLSPDERQKVFEDDVMLYRMIMVYIVADMGRKALRGLQDEHQDGSRLPRRKGKTRFLLEQPAEPEHQPSCASWWRTEEWFKLKKYYDLELYTFDQQDWGGKAHKPTSVATDLEFDLPTRIEKKVARGAKVENSKELSRWAPGFMQQVANGIVRETEGPELTPKVGRMSWADHIRSGHVPFRRDCATCQRAAARQRPHFRNKHPEAYVLSLDLAGPFKRGYDINGNMAKFLLVGAYTWPVEKAVDQKDAIEDVVPEEMEEEDLPNLEEGEEEAREELVRREIDDMSGDDYEPSIAEEDGAGGGAELRAVHHEGRGEDSPMSEEMELAEECKPMEVKTFMVAVPLYSKGGREVLAGVHEIYMSLRRHGYPVCRLHTDRGTEFVNKWFKSWAMNRGLLHTTSTTDEHAQNGRAEAAINSIKSRVRRLLRASEMEACWWPSAARHVSELERREREGQTKELPQFGQKVLVRKRDWVRGEFKDTMEKVTYLTPVYEVSHGHAVMDDRGRFKVISYFLKNLKEPRALDDEWEAVERPKEEPLQLRRRLREKTSLQELHQEADADLRHRVHLGRLIREEELTLSQEDPEVAAIVAKAMIQTKNIEMVASERPEEDEVLQTQMVATSEIFKEKEKWDLPIRTEMDSLLTKAMKRLPPEEAAKFIKENDVEVLPGKAVAVKKAPTGKRKFRIVICGNFQEKNPDESLYASGADAVTVRACLQWASTKGWKVGISDIAAAFLQAPLYKEGEVRKKHILMRPPDILHRLGYIQQGELWYVEGAVYGLKISPKRWGNHRDEVIAKTMWIEDGFIWRFEQCWSEPNLWKIKARKEQHVGNRLQTELTMGAMLIYVDDLMLCGNEDVQRKVWGQIKGLWKIAEPVYAQADQPIKFLGINIYDMGEDGFYINQQPFIQELVKRYEMEGEKSGTPMSTRDVADIPEEPSRTTAQVKAAQKIAGELLWISTRTRPDISYGVSRLCSACAKSPLWAVENWKAHHQVPQQDSGSQHQV